MNIKISKIIVTFKNECYINQTNVNPILNPIVRVVFFYFLRINSDTVFQEAIPYARFSHKRRTNKIFLLSLLNRVILNSQ